MSCGVAAPEIVHSVAQRKKPQEILHKQSLTELMGSTSHRALVHFRHRTQNYRMVWAGRGLGEYRPDLGVPAQDGGQDPLSISALGGIYLAQEEVYFSCLFFSSICYFQVPKNRLDTEHHYAHHNLNTAGNFNISAACKHPSNTCIFYLIYCNTFLPSLESNFSLKRNCLIGKCTKYNYTAYKLQYCLWE